MRKRLFIALILILMLLPAGIAQAKKPLALATEYSFVGHLGDTDAEGRTRAWAGSVSGDFTGSIEWWMFVEDMKFSGQVNHFADGRWVIYDSAGVKVLEGVDFGSTTNRPGKTGVWRANGTVTYANPDFPELYDWLGRQVHEGGEFEWVIPGVFPSHGWGTFRIN